jgi:hypothetical protein
MCRRGGTITETKQMYIQRLPNCNRSKEYVQEYGTAKNYK